MKYLPIILGAALCLVVGFAASALQADSLQSWYPLLNKPSLTPPDAAFPVAWTILYILMGASIGLVWMRKPAGYQAITGIFVVQLVANFLWSVVFFNQRSPGAGLAVIVTLLVLLLIYFALTWRALRASAYLFIPYILWVGFAAYMNYFIFRHN